MSVKPSDIPVDGPARMRAEQDEELGIQLKNMQAELKEDVYSAIGSQMNYLDDQRRKLVGLIEFHQQAMQQLGEACEYIDKFLKNEVYSTRTIDSSEPIDTDEWTEIKVKNSKY